jgi:hypothetical protein
VREIRATVCGEGDRLGGPLVAGGNPHPYRDRSQRQVAVGVAIFDCANFDIDIVFPRVSQIVRGRRDDQAPETEGVC